jgi:hypothetical protein
VLDRRKFLQMLGLGSVAALAEQAIPLNRAWSFPKQIVIPKNPFDYSSEYRRAIEFLKPAVQQLANEIDELYFERLKDFDYLYSKEWNKPYRIGQAIRVKMPQRYIVSNA